MNSQNPQDYKKLLSEVIKKQIVILGPDITLAKARNVPGLVIADDGTVTDISGDSQQLTQKLIDQFVQLSGEIVKKTMEPLLMMNQNTPTPPLQAPAVASTSTTPQSTLPPLQAASTTPPSSPTPIPTPQQPTPTSQTPIDNTKTM